jgi:alpha-beta hydrolase superfamily lysophospholipase
LVPRFSLPPFAYDLPLKGLARDKKIIRDYERDPFVYHGKMRFRTGYELLMATRRGARAATEARTPLLILHGSDDIITDPRGSVEFYERAPAESKRLEIIEGGFHELLQDDGSEEITAMIAEWLEERIA